MQGLSVEKDDVNLEEFDASYFMIPKADGYKVAIYQKHIKKSMGLI